MSDHATYGELMDRAAVGIARGVSWVEHLHLGDREHAELAITEFHATLLALEEHTWKVLDPRRVPGIAASSESDPRERAAAALIERLRDTSASWGRVDRDEGVGTSPWAKARRSIRAASDLLATHLDPRGVRARTPDVAAVLRDPESRQAALARVGELAATLLAGEDHLLLRARQAGVPKKILRSALPGLGDVAACARDVAGADGPPTSSRLEDLTVASPRVSTREPAAEVSDRMLRLRRAAWALPQQTSPSVESLKSFSVLAVVVHGHALANLGYPPSELRKGLPADPNAARLVERSRAWTTISRTLFPCRTPAPADRRIAADVARVSAILRDFAPLSGPQPELKAMDRRHLGQALNAAVEMCGDIAQWNVAALEQMAGTEQLHVPARALTGDQVTDHPHLVEAKLADRLAPTPHAVVHDLAATYKAVATRTDSRLLGAGGLTLRAEPLRADVSSIAGSSAGIEPIHATRA